MQQYEAVLSRPKFGFPPEEIEAVLAILPELSKKRLLSDREAQV